jgi:hypothetical protein
MITTSENGGSVPFAAVIFVIPFSGYENTIASVSIVGATRSFVLKVEGETTTVPP